jgi:hypothetical protein
MNLLGRTRAVLTRARDLYRDPGSADQLSTLAARLDEPLRVAIAGRVKAGKSTLLNALVADRLAATDAGECTRVVTWYRDGHTYQVLAHLRDGGTPRQLPFHRDHGAIEVDLAGLRPEQLERLTVTWPSQALRDAVLVDTPGIGSLSDQVSARTWQLLAPGEEDEAPADAVIYLLRHLHRNDLDFLHAFHDTEVSRPNPVNAIGVLSRADEIGVGRLDAMTSARRIAARMATDPDVRRVVQTVVPVAGLLAETAATLTEAEVAQLRTVARLPVREAESLLLSADRFVQLMPELGLTATEREALLERFGLFGVRLATVLLRRQVVATATELATELTDRSGIAGLRQVLDTLFFERRDVLKSRSVLFALDTLLRTRPLPGSEAIAAEVEEIVASAHTFNELRILSAVRAGWVDGEPELLTALEDIVGGGGAAAHRRLRLPARTDRAALVAAAGAALATWQRRAENPLTSHELAVAARVAVRSCEGMIAELGTHDHDNPDRS